MEIYVCLQDERHISLIELIDAYEKTMKEGWQKVGRMSIGETHHCTFIPAVCTLKRAEVLIIPTMFDTVATISATLLELWWP